MTRYYIRYLSLASLLVNTIRYVSGQECNEVEFRSCITTITKLSQDEFETVLSTTEEIQNFCRRSITESNCFHSEFCRNEYPRKWNLMSALYNHANQICNVADGRRILYPQVDSCHKDHLKDFKQCDKGSIKFMPGERDEDVKVACWVIRRILCIADISRQYCGESGRSFASFIETGLKNTFESQCLSFSSRLRAETTMCLLSLLILLASFELFKG